uniref:ABC transporter permease subunit n=1 Tax=Desulfacinum infernum TaxID=35837 RepID=A0A832EHS6_9BACT
MKPSGRFFVLKIWAAGCALAVVSGAGLVVGFVIRRGAPALRPSLLFGAAPPWHAVFGNVPVFDGLWPAVLGTVSVVLLAVGFAVPLGLAAGIYLAEFARGRTKQMLSVAFDILAGIPSIVIGLFGFSLSLTLHRFVSPRIGPCLVLSAFCLGILVLPYLIRAVQSALEGLPLSLRLTALSLGAHRVQNLRYVLLPSSLNAIATGVILAIGRCAEDTAVILLTGAVALAGKPRSLLENFEALPFYIYYVSSQYTSAEELERGFGAAIILLAISLGLYLIALSIRHRIGRQAFYGR